jgi:hypothetical protein
MFIPEGNEKIQGSNYLKLAEGENPLRILKEPITGFSYWVEPDGSIVPKNTMSKNGSPVRIKSIDNVKPEILANVKAFSACVVYNYNLKKIQVWEITQVSIMTALDNLYNSKSWGDVTDYDIVVKKTKTGTMPTDVDYSVMPEPKSTITREVLEAYEARPVYLEALYLGEDPFVEVQEITDADMAEIEKEIEL